MFRVLLCRFRFLIFWVGEFGVSVGPSAVGDRFLRSSHWLSFKGGGSLELARPSGGQ